MDEVGPCICTAKWLQTTLYLQNGYNHSCHHPSPHKIPIEEVVANPAALHNSSYKKKQRMALLSGVRCKECEYCWNIENLNTDYFSDRHYKTADAWAWDRFEEVVAADPAADIDPAYLEVSFSNACNLACAYCSPEISSKWLEDINKHGVYPTTHSAHDLDWLRSVGRYPYAKDDPNPYVDAFWKWFPSIVSTLKVLRLTGGEPLLSTDMWKLLDFMIENPCDIDMAINTNMYVPDELIDKLILKVNALRDVGINVDVYTSLESTGLQAEYVRDGLEYNTWISNVRKVLDQTQSTVPVMTTMNILSLPTFEDFIELIMDLRKDYNHDFAYNRVPMSINILRWPPHLQCTMLDLEVRRAFATSIKETAEGWLKYYRKEKFARIYLEEWDQIKRFCEYLETDNTLYEHRPDFVKFIDSYDYRRGKNFERTFPEYAELIRTWNA